MGLNLSLDGSFRKLSYKFKSKLVHNGIQLLKANFQSAENHWLSLTIYFILDDSLPWREGNKNLFFFLWKTPLKINCWA